MDKEKIISILKDKPWWEIQRMDELEKQVMLVQIKQHLLTPMLDALFDAGYEKVWIGPCKHWITAPITSVIGEPKTKDNSTIGWPAVWEIVRKYAGSSCGNGLGEADQSQASEGWIRLFTGNCYTNHRREQP